MRRIVLSLALVGFVLTGSGIARAAEVLRIDHRAITVIDGDSIQAGARVIQIRGIDAPELGQACDHKGHYWLCGLTAAYELRRLIGLQIRPIECEVEAVRDGVTVATCAAGGEDIAGALIASGLVVATPDSSQPYQMAERQAKRARLGIWSGEFVPPIEWRQGKRLPEEHKMGTDGRLHGRLPWTDKDGTLTHDPTAEHAACLVKGVIESGQHVFYGPLDREYAEKHVDPSRGDELLCGDDAARIAGWRHKGEAAPAK